MRFYVPSEQFYCGIDLHANSMYVCVVDSAKRILVHRNLSTKDTAVFLELIAPYRHSIIVGCESTYAWYWLADFCADKSIAFILGHALYMKAIHGGKTKNDRIDSHKIALLIQAGMFPIAYVYPRKQRAVRDLLRRRLYFVRERAMLLCHVQLTNQQLNLSAIGRLSKAPTKRAALPERFADPSINKSVTADLSLVDYYDTIIKDIESHIMTIARNCYTKELAILQSIKGVGDIIALTILFEADDILRFGSPGCFCSYARLVAGSRESAGKIKGLSGRKIGNVYLKHIFSEAAVYVVKFNPRIQQYFNRLQSKKGAAKAYSIIAHKLGKTIYHMLNRSTVFDEDRFLAGYAPVLRQDDHALRLTSATAATEVIREPLSSELQSSIAAPASDPAASRFD
jgi:transposase